MVERDTAKMCLLMVPKVLARDPSTRLLDGQFQFWTGEKSLSRLCGRVFLQAFFIIDDSEYCQKVLSLIKNLYTVSEMRVFLSFYKQCAIVAAIIADQGSFHCTVFLFFAEHLVTSRFASGVNINSQNGLDGSFGIVAELDRQF